MKKRVFALACAFILMFGMSVTAFAAPSPSTDDAAAQYTQTTLDNFAKATTVETTVAGTTVTAVTPDIAAAAAAQAKTVGANASVVTVVDLNVPEGAGEASFTLKNAAVKAGDNVVILHQKADGTWETITPSNIADGAVTFTLKSYSPVAIVVVASAADGGSTASGGSTAAVAATGTATAPKTGDMSMMISVMAAICLAGVVIFGKKAKLN